MSIDEEAGTPISRGTADVLRRSSPGQCAWRKPRRRRSEDGEAEWHYQMVHHGIWDFDAVRPILADRP